MGVIKQDQEEVTGCLDPLEDPSIASNDLERKELLRVAMSSYYLLYRWVYNSRQP